MQKDYYGKKLIYHSIIIIKFLDFLTLYSLDIIS